MIGLSSLIDASDVQQHNKKKKKKSRATLSRQAARQIPPSGFNIKYCSKLLAEVSY